MFIQELVSKVKNSTNSLIRMAMLAGIIAAIAGPFLMLLIGGREANNLPWYIWVMVPLLLLVVMATGFMMFRRESHEAADISIRPKPR